MKTRAILGTLVAVALSLLFAGTALAEVVDATYPPGDPKAFIVTEWKITPDGRLHVAGESTVANGFSGSIVGVGKNGEPSLITFDKKEDMAAAYKARNWELPSMLEPGMLSMASGSANINCYAEIWNPTYKKTCQCSALTMRLVTPISPTLQRTRLASQTPKTVGQYITDQTIQLRLYPLRPVPSEPTIQVSPVSMVNMIGFLFETEPIRMVG